MSGLRITIDLYLLDELHEHLLKRNGGNREAALQYKCKATVCVYMTINSSKSSQVFHLTVLLLELSSCVHSLMTTLESITTRYPNVA